MFEKIRLPEYKFFLYLFIVSLAIYVVGILKVRSIIWGDSLYYYAYTRSIVTDQDIDFSNQAFSSSLGFPDEVVISKKTEKIINKFSPGTAIAWIPGFVVGQLISLLGNIVLGQKVFLTNGDGIMPQFFVAVSAILFSVLGLWFVYQTLKFWFSQKIAALTTIMLFLTTQVFYYTTMDPVNSHSISLLSSSVLLFQTTKLLKTQSSWQKWLQMGIVAGFLMLVRNQDFVVVLPILLVLLFFQKERFIKKLNWATLFGGSAFVILSAQLFATLNLFGVLGSAYLISGDQFNWIRPDFVRVLFSLGNGLFFFAPVLVLAVYSLFKAMIKKFELITAVCLLAFGLQLYIVAAWVPEIIGGPYGSRMFVSVLPHLSFGIAYFIKKLIQKTKKKFFWIIYLGIILLFFTNMMAQTLFMLYRF